jgi:hypothetical protein
MKITKAKDYDFIFILNIFFFLSFHIGVKLSVSKFKVIVFIFYKLLNEILLKQYLK